MATNAALSLRGSWLLLFVFSKLSIERSPLERLWDFRAAIDDSMRALQGEVSVRNLTIHFSVLLQRVRARHCATDAASCHELDW